MIANFWPERFTVRRIYRYLLTRPAQYFSYFLKDIRIINDKFDFVSEDAFKKIAGKKTISDFHGYECATFLYDYRICRLVKPKVTLPGNPWVFRARIWELEPHVDAALLEKGFHIAFCDLRELYGNEESNRLISAFYEYMLRLGFASKFSIIAMSRGSYYAYSWAVNNGEKIACIYADNPPLDFKSWPGGKGKAKMSIPDMKIFKKMHKLKTDEDVMNFKNNPIDMAGAIARHKFPILHICGDMDEFVPLYENTIPFKEKILSHGGNIQVIIKKGFRHHPHSLKDPSIIVKFIEDATKKSRSSGYKFLMNKGKKDTLKKSQSINSAIS